MTNPIVVFCEQREGCLKTVGLEALGAACRLGANANREIMAVVIGASVSAFTDALASHGASRILLAEDGALAQDSSEMHTSVLADVAARFQPVAMLMGATALGKDLAPKLAARLRTALIQDSVALEMDPDGSLLATRPVYGGQLRAVVKARTPLRPIGDASPTRLSTIGAKARARCSC